MPTFNCVFLGQNVSVDVYVPPTRMFNGTWSFVFDSKTYAFDFPAWVEDPEEGSLFDLFYAHTKRDDRQFGTAAKNTQAHESAVVTQIIRDVMRHLSHVMSNHGHDILLYASWYLGTDRDITTYAEAIQQITCHNIVYTNFYGGGKLWHAIQFH